MLKNDWQNVTSSALQRVKYNPETQQLHVQFHDHPGKPGPVAEYNDVSAHKFKRLMASESKGTFFHKHIRTLPLKHPWRYL